MIFLILYIIEILIIIHILINKKNFYIIFAWISICVSFPKIGIILYILLGLNNAKRIQKKWNIGKNKCQKHQYFYQKKKYFYLKSFHKKTFQDISSIGNHFIKEKILYGCNIIPLLNGDSAYPEMIKAINNAKKTIFLSTYLFEGNGIGKEFINVLTAAHKRNIEVKILIDGVGGLYCWPTTVYKLRKNKVPVFYFLPIFHIYYVTYLNFRNHCKLLLIDGEVGFTGGMNIHSDNVSFQGKSPRICDLHFKINGPILIHMQEIFNKYWFFATKKTIKNIPNYNFSTNGNVLCRGISTGPYQKNTLLQNILITALGSARKKIQIITPYFIPNNIIFESLISASIRGIKIEIILSKNNNIKFIKGVIESFLPDLIKKGIIIYYYTNAFIHTKLFLVDDFFGLVGSSNLDTRSFKMNFEYNLEIYSKKIVKDLNIYFNDLKKRSLVVSINDLKSKNFFIRLKNAFFCLFIPIL
uniref:Phospholipase D transphosphatidylase cardiolipin synthetase n=1 Tax=Candidatus Endecteinascidia fromenterensis TaxID=266021 RepID=G8D482_9GAMM|nr:phospholipase D transphosphatidylase cardiolipin synthetase [Candidatus Endoecteinascidia frumentensis]